MLAGMTITRMDNVGIVVADLDAAVSFFEELGMELEGRGKIEGIWADRTVGLDGIQSEIAMMRTPDAHSKLELTRYDSPLPTADDIDDTIARLRTHGAEILGDVVQYENTFRLCYLRGPAGIIVALAEEIVRE
jgi:catechol 2,3-dioxygenase-like lactoylglutathione lyase family enzyme